MITPAPSRRSWRQRPAAGRWRRSAGTPAGFTFLEIIVVIALLGILFSFAAPNLSGLTPKYRLRSAARALATRLEAHRIAALSRGMWLGIHYHLDGKDSYYQLVPPPPADYPDMPVADREPYARENLPVGLRIERVYLRGTQEVVEQGLVTVLFSPLGTEGSHSVTLATEDGRYLTVELNAITGIIDFFESQVGGGFEDFEG